MEVCILLVFRSSLDIHSFVAVACDKLLKTSEIEHLSQQLDELIHAALPYFGLLSRA